MISNRESYKSEKGTRKMGIDVESGFGAGFSEKRGIAVENGPELNLGGKREIENDSELSLGEELQLALLLQKLEQKGVISRPDTKFELKAKHFVHEEEFVEYLNSLTNGDENLKVLHDLILEYYQSLKEHDQKKGKQITRNSLRATHGFKDMPPVVFDQARYLFGSESKFSRLKNGFINRVALNPLVKNNNLPNVHNFLDKVGSLPKSQETIGAADLFRFQFVNFVNGLEFVHPEVLKDNSFKMGNYDILRHKISASQRPFSRDEKVGVVKSDAYHVKSLREMLEEGEITKEQVQKFEDDEFKRIIFHELSHVLNIRSVLDGKGVLVEPYTMIDRGKYCIGFKGLEWDVREEFGKGIRAMNELETELFALKKAGAHLAHLDTRFSRNTPIGKYVTPAHKMDDDCYVIVYRSFYIDYAPLHVMLGIYADKSGELGAVPMSFEYVANYFNGQNFSPEIEKDVLNSTSVRENSGLDMFEKFTCLLGYGFDSHCQAMNNKDILMAVKKANFVSAQFCIPICQGMIIDKAHKDFVDKINKADKARVVQILKDEVSKIEKVDGWMTTSLQRDQIAPANEVVDFGNRQSYYTTYADYINHVLRLCNEHSPEMIEKSSVLARESEYLNSEKRQRILEISQAINKNTEEKHL